MRRTFRTFHDKCPVHIRVLKIFTGILRVYGCRRFSATTFCFLTVVFSVVVALLGVFIFTAIRRNVSSSSSSLSDERFTLLSFSKVSLSDSTKLLPYIFTINTTINRSNESDVRIRKLFILLPFLAFHCWTTVSF